MSSCPNRQRHRTLDRSAPRPAPHSSHRSRAAGVGLMRSLPAPSPCRADCCARQMQHSTSQYDDLARVPRAQTRAGCRRRTIASRHRRHSSARCSCRVVPPIRDARFVDLILAIFTRNSGLAPGTGLQSPETGSQNLRYRDLCRRQRPHVPHLNRAKTPANCGLFFRDRETSVRTGLRGGGCSPYRTRLHRQFPANREKNREFRGLRPNRCDFCVPSASEFNGLQTNSLRKRTGNSWRHNREFFSKNREILAPEQGSRLGSKSPRGLMQNRQKV